MVRNDAGTCIHSGTSLTAKRSGSRPAAVWTFNLRPEQRSRLVVQERG